MRQGGYLIQSKRGESDLREERELTKGGKEEKKNPVKENSKI